MSTCDYVEWEMIGRWAALAFGLGLLIGLALIRWLYRRRRKSAVADRANVIQALRLAGCVDRAEVAARAKDPSRPVYTSMLQDEIVVRFRKP